MHTPDEDERWLEVQHLSRAIAEESIFPINKVESALCYVVVRARELERRLREAEQKLREQEGYPGIAHDFEQVKQRAEGATPEVTAFAKEMAGDPLRLGMRELWDKAFSLERRLREAEQRTKRAEAEAKVLREALNDQIQWVAAFAMGCGQHDVVMDSDRMKRARAALAAKEPGRG